MGVKFDPLLGQLRTTDAAGGGTGDMLKSVYDQAGKNAQLAADSEVIHLAGTETITGAKTFSNGLTTNNIFGPQYSDVTVALNSGKFVISGGNMQTTGNLTIGSGSTLVVGSNSADPDGWARVYIAGGGLRVDDDFRFKKGSGAQYITRQGGSGYDLKFQAPNDQLTLYGAGGIEIHQGLKLSGAGTVGAGKVLTSDASGNATWQTASGGSSFIWSTITASQTAAVNNGYITNNTTQIVLTLPATAAVGSIIELTGIGTGGWQIAQPAGNSINFGNVATTTGTGGSLTSTHYRDAVRLVCVVANTTWQIISSIGDITVV